MLFLDSEGRGDPQNILTDLPNIRKLNSDVVEIRPEKSYDISNLRMTLGDLVFEKHTRYPGANWLAPVSVLTCILSRRLINDRTKLHLHLFASMLVQELIRLVVYLDQLASRSDGGLQARLGIDNTVSFPPLRTICDLLAIFHHFNSILHELIIKSKEKQFDIVVLFFIM